MLGASRCLASVLAILGRGTRTPHCRRYALSALTLRTNFVGESIRQTVVAVERSLADSGVLDSFTCVDPDDAAAALHP
jgi:hypothetical protein